MRAWGWLVLSPDSRLFWLSGSDNAARFSPWEPYESRGSRTVLEGPWGATPWGYLTSFRLVREQNLALALAVVSKIFSRKALRSNFNLCGAVGGPASQRCNNSFLRASLHIAYALTLAHPSRKLHLLRFFRPQLPSKSSP